MKVKLLKAPMKFVATLFSFIPSNCPFARTVTLGDHTFHVPPLCKLNPFYGQIMSAKFWAMTYLESHE